MIKRMCVILVSVALLSPGVASARPIAYNLAEYTPVNAAFRSTAVPGWGQFFNGQKAKGFLVLGGVVVSAAATYVLNEQASKAYDDYEKDGVKYGYRYSDYTNKHDQAMYASFLVAGVWAYGIADAYFTAKSSPNFNAAKNDDGVRLAYIGRECRLVYSKRF